MHFFAKIPSGGGGITLPSRTPIDKNSTPTSVDRAARTVAVVLKTAPIIMDVLLLIICIPIVITNKAEVK